MCDFQHSVERIILTRPTMEIALVWKAPDSSEAGGSLFDRAHEGDTHRARTVPAVLRLHPQLLVPVHQAVGAAGPLAVTALQLGQPRLRVVQLKTRTESGSHRNQITSPPRPFYPGRFSPRASAGRCSLKGHRIISDRHSAHAADLGL